MARYTYKHIDVGNRHITLCFSRYAGKEISAKADCSEYDVNVPEIGEQIARARLDSKIQRMRIKHHKELLNCYITLRDYFENKIDIERRRMIKDEKMLEDCTDIIKKYL
jgi:hypothetical protein